MGSPHNLCLFLTENLPHRLNARRVSTEIDSSAFDVTGALNHFRSGNSGWTDQKPTVTMETGIISAQVSDGAGRNVIGSLQSL
jgi:hypothetical protein